MTAPAMTEWAMIHPQQDYLRYLADGQFMLLRARGSGRIVFPPRIAEPGTGDTDLEWIEASGLGTVYSTSVMRERPPKASYNIALIDLDEGGRLMSRVEGIPPQDVAIGMRVHARIVSDEGEPLLVFMPQ